MHLVRQNLQGLPQSPMRGIKRVGLSLAVGMAVTGVAALGIWVWWHPSYTREEVVYGRKFGTALTLDVFKPSHPNGLGIVVVVSGSWRSSRDGISAVVFAPFLHRGYTLFAVVHGSQPRFHVDEIAADLHRAIRYIRYHASRWPVDPDRLGIVGGSSGGHLSLLMATRGGPGDPGAKDPVDRATSAVQCVAVFYPVTDLLNLGRSTENPGDGGPPKSFRAAFGPRAQTLETWRLLGAELSPINHVRPGVPPTLIYHGDADTLVPIDQSERFVERVRSVGGEIELVVRPGKRHGWPTMVLDVGRMATWFDEHLRSGPDPLTGVRGRPGAREGPEPG
jgi:acetyl esterase/lipase